jgi:hypothetical protein
MKMGITSESMCQSWLIYLLVKSMNHGFTWMDTARAIQSE